MPSEEYVFYESDSIDNIFFLVRGSAAFVNPFLDNVVYIEIQPGDKFGELDIVNSSFQTEVAIDVIV